MIINGILNEDAIKELKMKIISGRQKTAIFIAMLLGVIIMVAGIITNNLIIVVEGSLLVVILIIEFMILIKKFSKQNISRMTELYGKKECKFTLTLNEDKIIFENAESGGKLDIDYATLNKVYVSKNNYYIFSKTRMFHSIAKTELQGDREKEMLNILKEKCGITKVGRC